MGDCSKNNEVDMTHSVIKVYGYGNKYDYTKPWQAPRPIAWRGSGFVIDGRKIITNAHVVADNNFIQIRLANKSKRYIAKVLKVGHDCDLALLTVEDEEFWKNVTPLQFGDNPSISQEIAAWGFPLGIEEVSVTKGTISNLAVRHYVHSGIPLLAAQISAAINPGNSGGPVTSNGKVIGVAFQGITNAQNMNFIIPVDTIKHFLEDGLKNEYKGFPGFLVGIQTIDNPNLINYLNMKPHQTGVRVTGIHPTSDAYGKLKPDDVLLKIDGHNIYNDSFVQYGKERIKMSHFITKNKIGDSVTFDVLRKGKEFKVNCVLRHKYASHKLIPLMQYDEAPTYLSISGVVIQPLTLNFLVNMFENRNLPPLKFLDMNQRAAKFGHLKELIFVSNILPNEQTLGYQNLCYNIIHSINGKLISCMEDAVDAIVNNKDKYHQIILEGNQKIIVENLNKEVHKQILKKSAGFEKEHSDNLMLFYKKAKEKTATIKDTVENVDDMILEQDETLFEKLKKKI